MSELVKRIPSEDLEKCQNWTIPEMTSNKVIPSVKKNNQRNNEKTQRSKREAHNKKITEKIEDVEINEESIDIKPMTAEQLQKITDDAEKEGFDSGFEKGLEEGNKKGFEQGQSDAKDDIAEKIENLSNIIEALSIPLDNDREKIATQIIETICSLTRALIKKELETDSSIIVDTVNNTLSLLQDTTQSSILYLNSKDLTLVKDNINTDQWPLSYDIDDSLLPGGCRLENKNTRIDASIENQIEQLIDDFLHQKHKPVEEHDKDSDMDAATVQDSNHEE